VPEYRLLAQEREQAVKGADTLMIDRSFLQLRRRPGYLAFRRIMMEFTLPAVLSVEVAHRCGPVEQIAQPQLKVVAKLARYTSGADEAWY